jgi:hypothetical protein
MKTKFDELTEKYDELDTIRIALDKLLPQLKSDVTKIIKEDLQELKFAIEDDMKELEKDIYKAGIESGDIDPDDGAPTIGLDGRIC